MILVIGTLTIIGKKVYDIDPFFHYHKPDTTKYFYVLDNQRSQNDGISKHFDYNAMITGTSMTENFKTSEMDAIFGTSSIKVPFSGASFKEVNDHIKTALEHNPSLKTVVRGLDMDRFFDDSGAMRFDLGTYPTYLYDNNPFNDVRYLFNRNIIFDRIYPMITEKDSPDFTPGITSFDVYLSWQDYADFGIHTVCPEGVTVKQPEQELHLTAEDKAIIDGNIEKNVTSLANEYPEVTFYYFFPPYSAVWWGSHLENGNLHRIVEAEQYIIEKILPCKNIKLYSFNTRTDLTTNLNHYKDTVHYGQWVNSAILQWIHDGNYLLTPDNYQSYLQEELDFYSSFDYQSLNSQEDYEDDYDAAPLLH